MTRLRLWLAQEGGLAVEGLLLLHQQISSVGGRHQVAVKVLEKNYYKEARHLRKDDHSDPKKFVNRGLAAQLGQRDHGRWRFELYRWVVEGAEGEKVVRQKGGVARARGLGLFLVKNNNLFDRSNRNDLESRFCRSEGLGSALFV